MPMIPELPVAMLACTRIGVAHSVIFGGFSPDAIIDRCEDAEAKLIIKNLLDAPQSITSMKTMKTMQQESS